MKRSLFAVALLLALDGIALGCYGTVEIDSCGNPDRVYVSSDGTPDPCITCKGECVPIPSGIWWHEPVLLWVGSVDEPLPQCPHERAPTIAYEGFADVVAPDTCSPCSCEPPTGSCELPSTISARAAPCETPGAWTTSFDPPPSWDGSCTDVNAIPQGTKCGGAPCVQSLIIDPLSIVESACSPSSAASLPVGAISWKTHARACLGVIEKGTCSHPQRVCVPSSAPPPPGFRQCVYDHGDVACPPEYPDKQVLYSSFTDKRDCSACECGPPMGSTCVAQLSIYSDNVCSSQFNMYTFDATGSLCVNLAPIGSALGSKSISNVTYQPGTCAASGGEPIGSVELNETTTFCCR